MVEMAVISSALFIVILGSVVGSLGVFRYQQVSAVAREAARYASVHGGQYAADTGNAAATTSTIYSNVVWPMGVGLNLPQSSLTVELKTYTVSESVSTGVVTVKPVTQAWDSSDKYPYVVTGSNGAASSTSVVVIITYTWAPEFLGWNVSNQTPLTVPMQTRAEIPMSY